MNDKNRNLYDILNDCPDNQVIKDSLIKAYKIINDPNYKNILVSISGGADSDVMLDIVERVRNFDDTDEHKITYIWFNTGLEYQATKDHLMYLEDRYNIKIIRTNAYECKNCKTIIKSCNEYGQPFLSKRISQMISRLQKHGFNFKEDSKRTYEECLEKFPKCKHGLQFWFNKYKISRYNVGGFAWAKEFIIENPPTFKISDKCCTYAKKNVSKAYEKNNPIDLKLIGVRKAEGGNRASVYKTCYDQKIESYDNFRPIFWYSDNDKKEYEEYFNVIYSKCYTEYGLHRTGCVGCPFAYKSNLWDEIKITEQYEPKLYKAVNNVFANTYEYTRKYDEFRKKMNKQYKSYANYLRLQESNEL